MIEKQLTMGSLFDGSGAFPLASMMSGIIPVWASEICPYPILVTTKRLPFMKHYGDISKMNGGKIEPVDIITFGSPCQDMSIAGKREGLDGARSGLFYQAVRIIKEMQEATNGQYPRYAVWENVCGALSSNDGEDFRCVLESLSGIAEKEVFIPKPKKGKWGNAGEIVGDGFSIAWRILSAEYFGVPQRRKRIYLVADFGGSGAGKILFEREGLPWHTPEGFRAGEAPSAAVGGGAEGAGRARLSAGFDGNIGAAYSSIAYAEELSPTVVASRPIHVVTKALDGSGEICLNDQGGDRMDVLDGVAPTLRAQSHQHEPLVLHAVGFKPFQGKAAHGIGYEEEKSPTLLAGQEAGVLVGIVPYTLKIRGGKEGGGKGPLVQKDKSATLTAHQDQTLFQPTSMLFESHPNDSRVTGPVECAPAVVTRYGTGGGNTPLVVEKVSPVAFGVCGKTSQGYLSDNPKVGFYEAETARTLDTRGGDPTCNQGGICVVEPVEEDTTYCSTVGSFMHVNKEVANTLCARDYKDPQIVNVKVEGAAIRYIVRRLTPTECARLQGMPDWWCDGLEINDPSTEEMEFWRDAFETWRMATSPSKKPKTDSQIRKWLAGPFPDSEQYKLWGNGIALPCGYFVLSGIATMSNLPAN